MSCGALRAAGRADETPVAVVSHATTAAQRVVTGTLSTIVRDVTAPGIVAPAVIVIGDVVAIGQHLAAVAGRGDAAAITS